VVHTLPKEGDIALFWDLVRNCFSRASVVVEVGRMDGTGVRCLTISAHSRSAKARVEWFLPSHGDRFLRWVDLERPTLFGVPVARAA
jgi:hypothetical protein